MMDCGNNNIRLENCKGSNKVAKKRALKAPFTQIYCTYFSNLTNLTKGLHDKAEKNQTGK